MTHDLLRYARESAIALREAQAEIKRLRKVIENAPHDEKCAVAAYWKHNWEGDVNCTCWKREAGNE